MSAIKSAIALEPRTAEETTATQPTTDLRFQPPRLQSPVVLRIGHRGIPKRIFI